jgi:hypothetical protein
VARRLYYTYKDDTDTLLQQGTYRCFCYQQINFNADDSYYIYPPYDDGGIKEVCKPYLRRLVRDEISGWLYGFFVAVLNFMLRVTLQYLTILEKPTSLASRDFSDAVKVLPVLFINTSIMFMLANGYFNNDANSIGFGFGSYSEISKSWFVTLGKSYLLSIIMGTVGALVGQVAAVHTYRWIREKYFKTELDSYYLPRFNFAFRLCFTGALISGCAFFCGGIPLLIIFGLVYCVLAIISDRYALLRLYRTPYSFSPRVIALVAEAIIFFGVFLHSMLTMWIFSNQQLFPSNSTYLSGMSINVADYYNLAQGGEPSSSTLYARFIANRAKFILSNGAVPSMILLILSGSYLLYRIITTAFNVSPFKTFFRQGTDQYISASYTTVAAQLKQEGIVHTYDIAEIATV